MKRKESCPLQTTALEEKIKQLSADYIYEQAVGSLLLMLMSAMEDVEKATRLCLTPYMKICWLSKRHPFLPSVSGRHSGRRTGRPCGCSGSLLGKKEELLSIYETVYSYFSQWNLYSTLVSDQVALRKYKEEGIEVEKSIGLCSLRTVTLLWKAAITCWNRKITWVRF